MKPEMKGILLLPLCLLSCKTPFSASRHMLNKGFPNNNVVNLTDRLHRSVLRYHPQLVIIMIGTNDMVNPPKMMSLQAYRKKLNHLVATIKGQGSDVLLLSPPPVDTTTLFTRRSRDNFTTPPNTKIDSVVDIMKETAAAQHCMFLDINAVFRAHDSPNPTGSSLIRNQINSGRKDGVHPTPAGYELIAQSVFHYLKSQGKHYTKIICFGDSITFGAYAKGEGSTRGETYPAVLKRMLFPGD
jgi:lysophospholipase L1-like esterase